VTCADRVLDVHGDPALFSVVANNRVARDAELAVREVRSHEGFAKTEDVGTELADVDVEAVEVLANASDVGEVNGERRASSARTRVWMDVTGLGDENVDEAGVNGYGKDG
jgi:hypothetical protein